MGFGQLIAELGMNISPFRRSLDTAAVHANKFGRDAGNAVRSHFGRALAGAFSGAAVVGGLQAGLQRVINRAVEIGQLSKQFGVTTDQLQNLQQAALDEGLAEGTLLEIIEKINMARKSALSGNMEHRRAFAELGITVEQANDALLSDYDILRKITQHLETDATPAARAFFKAIAGERAGQAIPALMRLKNEFNPIPKESVQQIMEAKRALDDLERTAMKLAAGPLGAAAGTVNDDNPLLARLAQFGLLSLAPASGWRSMDLSKVISRYLANKNRPAPLPGDDSFIGPSSASAAELYEDALKKAKANDILEARKSLEEALAKIEFDKLDRAGQMLALEEKINRLKSEGAKLFEAGDEAGSLRIQQQMAETEQQLYNLQNQKGAGKDQSPGLNQFPADEQIRYGNFLGSTPGEGIEREVRTLRQVIDEHLREIRQNTRNTAEGVRDGGSVVP